MRTAILTLALALVALGFFILSVEALVLGLSLLGTVFLGLWVPLPDPGLRLVLVRSPQEISI